MALDQANGDASIEPAARPKRKVNRPTATPSLANHRQASSSGYQKIGIDPGNEKDKELLSKKRKRSAVDKDKKPRDPRKSTGETRSRRWRATPPASFREVYERATTQTFYVLQRTRTGTEDCPSELVEIAGTTGNKYDVNIGPIPNCTCPHAKKSNQCKHIVYVMCRTLKAPTELQYQLAFIPSELQQIFARAPPIPGEDANDTDGNRKPIEDDCPICCVEFDAANEEIVYCKAACGNNVHKGCFEQWAASKRIGDAGVTCPFCRTPWQGDEDSLRKIAKMGKVNAEGYVNLAQQLGLSGRRDYSTYHPSWVRRQVRLGNIDDDAYNYYDD